MKGIRGFLGAHKRVFALGVFFCCILLSAFMLIPSFGGVGAAKRDAAAGDFTAEAKPLHAYTKLEVEMPKGLTVYTGKTTVREFKENLTVIGTYKPSAASSEVSVELLPSEYLLVDNTGANIDVKDDEPVMRNSTEGGQPNSVDCGSASAPVGDIAIEDEYPILADDTVFSVSVKDGMEIENVNTSESIKKLLM